MMNTYTLDIEAVCPVDQFKDVYRLTVRSTRIIPVESILAAVKAATAKAAYQEDITAALSRVIGAEVQTDGWHSGVRVVSVCGNPI